MFSVFSAGDREHSGHVHDSTKGGVRVPFEVHSSPSVIELKVSLAQRRHWYALSIAHLFHALNAFMAALRLSFGRAEGLRTHNLRPLFHATYKLRMYGSSLFQKTRVLDESAFFFPW